MKRPDHSTWWLAGASLLLLIGGIWTVSTLQRYPAQKRHIERKIDDLQQIAAYQRAQKGDLAAVQAFENLPANRPIDLSTLLREQAPVVQSEVRRRETRAAWGDWQAHRMEVRLERVPLDVLGRFLSAAEQQRPPWRLIESNIVATEEQPGAARATLVFEGLAKR